MIPTRLELHNFGAIQDACVDLSAIDLASVVGANGIGKSTTFTIAPIWALFGGTKNGCAPDHLVRLGESDARVAIEFEHRGEFYRVVRTRSTNGRGKSSLELQKMERGESWVSLSGATIRETEEAIRDLLGLDEETFTSSSMILQGRANEFTAKSPGQRKQILAQILGLEVYERLQEAARRHRVDLDARCSQIRRSLEEFGNALSGKAELESRIVEIESEIRTATKSLEGLEESLREAETALIRTMEAGARAKDLEMRISGIKTRLAEGNRRMGGLVAERANLEALLAQEPEILAGVEALKAAQETVRNLEALESRRGVLRQEYAGIDREAKTLAGKIAEIDARLEELRRDLSMKDRCLEAAEQLPALKSELEEHSSRRERVLALEKEAEKLDQQIRDRKHTLERARLRLEAEIRNCDAQTAKLADAHCVNLEAARLAPCAFLKGAMEAAERLPALKSEVESLCDPEIETIQEKLHQLHDEIGCVHYDAERAEVLAARVRELEPLAERAGALASKLETVSLLEEQRLAATEKISELAERLGEIRTEGEELKAKLESLPVLRRDIEDLLQWEARKGQLPVARERIRGISEQVVVLQAEEARMVQECDGLAEELREIHTGDLLAAEEVVDEIREELGLVRNRLQDLHSDLGAARILLEDLLNTEEKRKKLKAELEPLTTDLARYQTLGKAFGRDGIPALVIENAVPELERIANEILGEMSQGRHALRFETQRELKSRSGMAETLDIIVSDWAGSRPYETFSGGEQLRIDYAIRFALAELLAQRAGSRIEWLVIDEGLGSQDREHRELVLEAIRSVAPRFRRVLMITHVEEAQGVFPQQIRFEPSEDGVAIIVG